MGLYHNPRIVTDGLVFFLDAANNKSYPGSGTNWYGLVKNNHGVLTNGPTFSGPSSSAVIFTTETITSSPSAPRISGGPVYDSGLLNQAGIWETNINAATFARSYQVTFPGTGSYLIKGSADDTGNVFIDGNNVLFINGFSSIHTSTVTVQSGTRTVTIEGVNTGGPGGIATIIEFLGVNVSNPANYFSFDGNDDYVNTVTATTLGISAVTTPFTLGVWFKTSGSGEYYFFDNYWVNITPNLSFRIDNGRIEIYLMASNGVGFNAIQFGSGYNNNSWHNACLVWNGSDTITVYVDGVDIGSSTQSGMSGNFESGYAFQIGTRPYNAFTPRYPGSISNFVVYNIALNQSQIQQNYNAIRGRYRL